MQKEIFETYYNNENVIKIISGGINLYNKKTDIIISFAFYHDPNVLSSCSDEKTRIFFEVYNSEKYQHPKPEKYVNDEILFLVNADRSDFAILFAVHIDNENKIAKLELMEKPLFGEELLTFCEKNGIIKYFNK